VLLDEPFSGLDPLAREEFTAGLLERAQDMAILIATHDLAEIENFATHLVYLESGHIRLNEEMQNLQDRYREYEVVLAGGRPRDAWPQNWINVEVADRVLRFVAADCGEDEVREALGGVERVETRPLGLKPLFVALAKEGRRR
jgi:ABC-2 type transport system ATP-binding protein